MRKAAFGAYIALLSGCLLLMASCEDKQSQSSPKEFDPQIDSIASTPLPVINPDMVIRLSATPDEPDVWDQEPSALESEPAPDTAADTDQVADNDETTDTLSMPDYSADPNNI